MESLPTEVFNTFVVVVNSLPLFQLAPDSLAPCKRTRSKRRASYSDLTPLRVRSGGFPGGFPFK